jgi:hypothetical protein
MLQYLLFLGIILLFCVGVFVVYVIVRVLMAKEPIEFDDGKPKVI